MPTNLPASVPPSPPPKVSVAMVTYNHEKFIGEAIESVLMQKTSFPIELIVGEDCSTDGTRAIVRKYAQTHGNIVRPLLHDRNVGAAANFRAVLAACSGEYIALLEGDDYWISTHKLEKQVVFLEAHPECSMCFGAHVDFIEGEGVEQQLFPPGRKPCYTLPDILSANFIGTCTGVFRKVAIEELPEWTQGMPVGDWPAYVLCATKACLGYIDEVLGARRRHPGGLWSSRGLIANYFGEIEFLKAIRPRLRQESWRILDEGIALRFTLIGAELQARGDRLGAMQAFFRGFFWRGASFSLRRKQVRKVVSCWLLRGRVTRPKLGRTV